MKRKLVQNNSEIRFYHTRYLQARFNTLKKENYDLKKCGVDIIYVFDITKQEYIPLDNKIYENILNGQMKF